MDDDAEADLEAPLIAKANKSKADRYARDGEVDEEKAQGSFYSPNDGYKTFAYDEDDVAVPV